MLSYRHAFHAGNFADVHKHIILSVIVQSLLNKDSRFCYLDTHAAAGCYDLFSAEAQKNSEFRHGILRLWQEQDSAPAAVRAYLAAIQAANIHHSGDLPRYYPGSPRIVRHFLRTQDRMILTELHTADFQRLQQEFASDRQVSVHCLDAYQGVKAFLPPKERRGLVLIDPAFERRNEAARMFKGLQIGHKRWSNGVFMLWFPITNKSDLAAFYQSLEKSGIRKILSCELCIQAPVTARRLNGSLMVIINPPWRVDKAIQEIQPWLIDVLTEVGKGSQKVEWRIPE
jgi:23S rRNA (adenine2030-N6)-methyltransferase